MNHQIVNADALTHLAMMDDESVHMSVTSPPYYSPKKGLRDYKVNKCEWDDGWNGDLGKEPTPQMYVKHVTSICTELHRVLRDDGTFWLNIGDSHAGSGCGPSGKNAMIKNQTERQGYDGEQVPIPEGFKRTDIFGIPFRLGIALQEAGWYWKDIIPWMKHNGMPGSYKTRPVSNIEWILILTKTPTPYYDYVAVMQKASESYKKDKRAKGVLRQRENPNTKYNREESQFKKQDHTGNSTYTGFNARYAESGGSDMRLLRSSDLFFQSFQGLWLDEDFEPMAMIVNPQGYKGHHFASFPVMLPEMCILASSSEKGVCPVCGAPWRRIVDKESFIYRPTHGHEDQKHKIETGNSSGLDRTGGHCAIEVKTTGREPGCKCDDHDDHDGTSNTAYDKKGSAGRLALLRQHARENGMEYTNDVRTIGFEPTCNCSLEPVPATVLDPFSGSAATGVACKWHNRNYIGIELNAGYCQLGEQRIRDGK